ncbi:PHD finger domain-containing protein [Coccidioides immitis RS]|uniref:Chromatin modification-related protein n=2 Tax=Coccidioides immitis TaxID=5501 RepID=J3KJJ4_COCIM|nr:PHD finger domain-containing protein [Coccidioides immitis RS]EAS36244.3 PHD finger domain-containing protein [Coccidioides immitis RS]TPX25621.1 hypothetical protein DIZ76_011076 [Coccidioides immitis]
MATSNGPMGTSNVRSSTLRQTRTNPSRQSKTAGRTSILNHVVNPFNNHAHNPSLAGGPGNGGAGSYAGGGGQYGAASQHPAGLYPGIHHFTDAIDALPREFRRHTSLLNEVDGKAFALEAQLPKLLQVAAELISEPFPIHGSVDAKSAQGFQTDGLQTESPERSAARRQAFQNIRNTLTDLLPTMDEKNHVARNAFLSLKKDVNRLEMIYPYVENEISEEARIGSRTHWAYLNKPTKASGTAGSERPRREAATRDRDADETHRESRREAGGRKQRRNQVEPEVDESRARKGNIPAKSRAGAGEASQVNQNVAASAGPSKRRRIEKAVPTPTSAAMERSASAATNAGRSGVKESPVPEFGKKRSRAQNVTAPSRKSTPPPSASNRPQSARLQQTAAAASNGRQRPSSATSNRNLNSSTSLGLGPAHLDRSSNPASIADKGILDIKAPAPKDSSSGPRVEPSSPGAAVSSKTGVNSVEPKADSMVITKPGERDTQREVSLTIATATTAKMEPQDAVNTHSPIPPSVTSKGRSSKTSTPVVSTFAESQRSSRPSRATAAAAAAAEGSNPAPTIKRSHKKGAGNTGTAAATARQLALAAANAAEDEDSSRHGDDEDDEGELRYCYCNQISFGDMIACDMENCPREWFHLSCVGLTRPPSKSVKWYCNECKETMKKGKSNGR